MPVTIKIQGQNQGYHICDMSFPCVFLTSSALQFKIQICPVSFTREVENFKLILST